ncbi:MAG TPA: ABC transporter substrate-binding protein [Microbacteriaceae bacterium]
MNDRITLSRRGFLAGTTVIGGAALLSACVGTGGAAGGGGASGALTLQSSLSDPAPKAALASVVKSYKGKVTLNTVAIEQFRAQLSTYLTSSAPPDVLTWYAGSVANDYASKDLLLDVSDLWKSGGACANFPPALKALSTAASGKQIFVPTNYYWWGIFHKKSAFAEWGITQPKTWDEFLAVCDKLKSKGISPLTMGTGSTPWVASGWFDYLDLRVNGATFHRELLAGKHSFDSTEVRNVMKHYAEILPFIDPNAPSYSWQEAVTPLVQNKSAMYLIGAFVTQSVPTEQVDDIDFFSVPTIDSSIPSAEEAPTDGYFASAKTGNKKGTLDLLAYLAAPKTQQDFIATSKSSNLPTSPDVNTSGFSPLVQKGVKLLAETKEITQFFNRDSSDALQTTADTALTKFMAQPGDVSSILKDWQTAAEKVWKA